MESTDKDKMSAEDNPKSEETLNGEGGTESDVLSAGHDDTSASGKSVDDTPKVPEEKTEENASDNKGKKRKLNEAKAGDESASEDSAADVKESSEVGSKTEKDDSANESSTDLTMPPKQTLGKGKRARIPNKRYSDILLSPLPKSHKSHIENGDKADTDNDTKNEDLSGASSPVNKKLKTSIDLSDPKYLKPFSRGWKRELVYRATYGNATKRNGDIYYYNPAGKKLRSMREISDNLDDPELSLENFTFFKEPIGLNDPEKEIIRDAKAINRKAPAKGSKTPKVLSPELPASKAASSKSSSPKENPEPVVPTRKSNRSTAGNIKIKLTPSRNIQPKKNKMEGEARDTESPPAKRVAKKKTPAKINVEMEDKPCQPCSIRCQGVLGMVPTLQCRLCLCLYHYECVGLSPHVQIQEYVCKNCRLEHGQNVATSTSIILPPLTPINTLKQMTTQSTVLPTLQRIPRPSDSPQQEVAIPGGVMPNMPRLLPLPKVAKDAPQPPKSNKNLQNIETKSLVGSVTTWLPHSSTIQVDSMQKNKENEPMEAPRPQYVEYLAGRKFLIIPKHNIVSISPTSLPTKQLKQNDSGCDESKDEAFSSPRNEQTDSDRKVEEDNIEMTNKTNEEKKDDENKTETVESAKRTPRSNNLKTNIKVEESKFMENYLQNVSYGYNTLLYVFQYLKVQDLLKAGCVCTMWRHLANHPTLWKTVRMKNSQVHSFEGLANALEKHGTVHLDLRKVLLPSKEDHEIWPEFSKAIEKVQTLRKIELCRCPASVVEQLAVTNKDLEVINAVTIKCETLNLDKISSLKNLKELRLKSPSSLTLTSDITSLEELTNLKHLSLTSIKDLYKMNLKVLAALKNLESLDLGECSDFPSNFGEDILIKLTKLEKLRLEKGQGTCHTFKILDAVRQMPQLEQLELVNFDIKAGFDVALGKCSNIKKLLIIPTYLSQSATTNHMLLGGVYKLQQTLTHFVWGVTLELLRVTELFVDQSENPNKKEKKEKKSGGNGDSIPVMEPIPLHTDKNGSLPPAHDPPQVEIIRLPDLQKLLLQSLPTTRVKILKIPFHATWRQSITDTVN